MITYPLDRAPGVSRIGAGKVRELYAAYERLSGRRFAEWTG